MCQYIKHEKCVCVFETSTYIHTSNTKSELLDCAPE